MSTKSAIPYKINLLLMAGITVAILVQMVLMPVLLRDHPWIMVAIALVLVPLNTPFWSLIHECIHKNFHPNRKVDEFSGRFMSVLFGASFGVLRFGHLMHHKFNREWESEYFPPEKKPHWRIYAGHYTKMLGGLYLIEVVLSFGLALAPRSLTQKLLRRNFTDDKQFQAVENGLLKQSNVTAVRIDSVLIVAFYAACFALYGANWPVLLLLIAGRAAIISIMDNPYHYDTPLDNSVAAKELQVPPFFARFILNFNHHLTHHNDTRVSWLHLPEHHEIQGNQYTEPLSVALIKQFKGPLPIADSKTV